MVESHFDYGNGYHGTAYLNPHRLFQQPGTIWRVAQDLIAKLPIDLVNATEVVSGQGRRSEKRPTDGMSDPAA